jgi:hypothetical protein
MIIISILALLLAQPRPDTVILVTGLESVITHTGQSRILSDALPPGTTVLSFRHTTPAITLAAAVRANPGARVVLFSAGCSRASVVLSKVTDPSLVFMVEPWAVPGRARGSVMRAIESGIPARNVVSGPLPERGYGIPGSTPTPQGTGHFGALAWSARLLSLK